METGIGWRWGRERVVGDRGQVGKGSNIDASHGIIGSVGGVNEVFLLWE